MHVMKTDAAVIAAICSTLLAFTPLRSQVTTSGGDKHASSPVLSFVNFTEDYRFTCFLNGEPLFTGDGLYARHWNGYPLKSGSNDIQFVAVALGTNYSTEVQARIDLESPFEQEIGNLMKICTGSNLLETNFKFNLPPSLGSDTVVYQSIPSNPQIVSNELAKLSLSIISAVCSRDVNRVTNILKVDQVAVKALYPMWFFDTNEPVTTTCVRSAQDVEVLMGQRLALVRPSYKYKIAGVGLGLCDVRDSSKDTHLMIDSFTFVTIDNHWCLLRPDMSSIEVSSTDQ